MTLQKEELFQGLSDAVVAMDEDRAVKLAEQVIAHGVDPYEAIEKGLSDGMERVGRLFEKEEYFVPELLICSDAMYAGLEVLKPHLKADEAVGKHKVVIGVIEGDTHDIGKNLVKIMMEASGFEVFDLGRDVPPARFVEKAKEVDADLIAISTLMTTTMEDMRKVLKLLEEDNVRGRFRVMVGGGPISKGFADRIGADGYAVNAGAAAKMAKQLLERRCVITMNPKERLTAVLRHREFDRPPVICPGGMMNAAVVEIMEQADCKLPAAHSDEDLMAVLATEVHEKTGFENIGLPFCMTVEAEVLGSLVNMGSLSCEPKIEKEAYPSVDAVPLADVRDLLESGRVRTVLGAIGRVSKTYPSIPVTGVVTGPLSAAASIVDPVTLFKELHKKRDRAHRVIDYVSDLIAAFAVRMVEAGAAVITVADPSSSGEILGPALFEEYTVRYLNKIADRVHAAGSPVIVHICGDMKGARHHLGSLKGDALSVDSVMNLARIKQEFPHITTMGNMSTQLLSTGPADRVGRTAERLIREGVNIIAPACGLDTRTPVKSIRALTDTVRMCAP